MARVQLRVVQVVINTFFLAMDYDGIEDNKPLFSFLQVPAPCGHLRVALLFDASRVAGCEPLFLTVCFTAEMLLTMI